MDFKCTVKNRFATSIGEVIVISVHENIKLSIGMSLIKEPNSKWKIIGIGMGIKPLGTPKVKVNPNEFIWNCNVEFVSGNRELEVDDLLIIIP